MKRIILATALLTALLGQAEIPQGYYDTLSGKSGEELKSAVKAIATPSEFSRVEYGEETWAAFRATDVRKVNGKEIWWDMYSNNMLTTDAHKSLNIEHSVANSWFGGKNAVNAYCDLFHLNPSDQEANNKKSSLPLGEVGIVAWQNGLVKIGAPKAGSAGKSSKVFEPADEYKGDFARAYLYIFTAYDEEEWKTDQTMYSYASSAILEPWALEMLCRWAAEDPVDSKEINRNEEIYKIQKNRNPFIDYPELAEYIWGAKKGEPFIAGSAATATDRPAEPVFSSRRLTGVNTYSSRWWESETVKIDYEEGDLWVSINGADYQQYGPGVAIPSAPGHGTTMSLSAYTEKDMAGRTLRSSTAYLTLTGRDPKIDDYTEAIYTPVANNSDFISATDNYFIIYSSSNGHIMGHAGGTSSISYLPDVGEASINETGMEYLPLGAAVVKFIKNNDGKYLLEVYDALNNVSKGYWNVGSGNKNTLKPNVGTSAEVTINEDGTALITFSGETMLQYNGTNPRFTNYTTKSNMVPVKLAGFSQFAEIGSGIKDADSDKEEPLAIDGNNINLPRGWYLYDLNGRTSDGKSLEPGIYIARSKGGKTVKVMIRQ